jgi:hypothetical protein
MRRQEAEAEKRSTGAAAAGTDAGVPSSEQNASGTIAKNDKTNVSPVAAAAPIDNIANKKKKNTNKKNVKGKEKVAEETATSPAPVTEAGTTPPKSSESHGANINISATANNEATDEKAAAAAERKKAKNKKRQEQRRQHKLAVKAAKVKAIASAKAEAVQAIAEENQVEQEVNSTPPVAAVEGSIAENPASGKGTKAASGESKAMGTNGNGSTTNYKHPFPQDAHNTTGTGSNGLAPKKAKKSESLGSVAPFQEGVEGESSSSDKKKKNAPKKKKIPQASTGKSKSHENTAPAVTSNNDDAGSAVEGSIAENPASCKGTKAASGESKAMGTNGNGSTTYYKHPFPQDAHNTTGTGSIGLAPKKAKKSESLGSVAPFQEGVEGESSSNDKKKKNAPKKKKIPRASTGKSKSHENTAPAVTPNNDDADDKEWIHVTSEEAPFPDVKRCDKINDHQHQVGLMMALASVDLSVNRDAGCGQQQKHGKKPEAQTRAHYTLDRSYFEQTATSCSGKNIGANSCGNGDGDALRAILFRDDSMTVGAIGMRDRVMEIYEKLHLIDAMIANGRLIRICSKAKALHQERLERHAPEEEDGEDKQETSPPVDNNSNADDILSHLTANDAMAGTTHSNNLMITQTSSVKGTPPTVDSPLQPASSDRDADIISTLLGNDNVDPAADIMSSLLGKDDVKVSKQTQENTTSDWDCNVDRSDRDAAKTDDREADIMSALLGNDKVLVPKTGPVPTTANPAASPYNEHVTVQEPAYDDVMAALWANDMTVGTELGGRPSAPFDENQQEHSEDVNDSFASWVDSDREVLVNLSPQQAKGSAETTTFSNRSSSLPKGDSSNAATTKTGPTTTTKNKNRNAFEPTEKEEEDKDGGCQECIGACIVS